jgi:type VI secretion system protein VasD
MLERRGFLVLAGAGLLAACGGPEAPPGPAVVNVAVQGGPGMNPGPDGADRPVTLTVLRLRDLGAFNTADLFALQNDPAAALGGDLVGLEQLAVAPGGSAGSTVTLGPDAPYLGFIALLREPAGKVWRTATPVAQGTTPTANVNLGPGGMALTLG